MDGRTDVRTENLPILQDFVPYRGRCPASQRKIYGNKEKQGKGIADHLMPLGDWLLIPPSLSFSPLIFQKYLLCPLILKNSSAMYLVQQYEGHRESRGTEMSPSPPIFRNNHDGLGGYTGL